MPKITKKMMNKIHNEMVRRFSPYWDRKNREISILRSDIAALQRAVRDLEAQPKHRAEVAAEPKDKAVQPDSADREVQIVWHGYGRHSGQYFLLSKDQYDALFKLGVPMEYVGLRPDTAWSDMMLRMYELRPTLVSKRRSYQLILDVTKILRSYVMCDVTEVA